MKYIKEFERHNFAKYDIIEEILSNIIKEIPKCWIYDSEYYEKTGILWILYKYKAKNKQEAIEKSDTIYSQDKIKIENILNKYAKNINITYQGRFARTNFNSNYGGRQKANETIYEITCNLKKEYFDKINVLYTGQKYNL